MNVRVVSLLRELADELATELERSSSSEEKMVEKPTPRKRKAPPPKLAPPVEISDLDRERIRRQLQRAGYRSTR